MGFLDIFKSSSAAKPSSGTPPLARAAAPCADTDRGELKRKGMLAIENRDLDGAFHSFTQLAEQGDAEGQCRLAFLFKSGLQNYERAAFWYRQAAEQGHAEAQCKLGFLYRSGRGVPKNDTEGAKWYQRSASLGYVEAQYNLGRCFLNGEGVRRDVDEAVRWFTSAAESRYPEAEFTLGVIFTEGLGVSQDTQKALFWLNRAAASVSSNEQTIGDLLAPPDDSRNSCTNALFNLGQIYRLGKLVPENHARAFQYFLKGAQLGDAQSQYAVGACYMNGWGISRDIRLGVEYLRKAALQGLPKAQEALARFQQR
jgi:hypothetical protein